MRLTGKLALERRLGHEDCEADGDDYRLRSCNGKQDARLLYSFGTVYSTILELTAVLEFCCETV